MPHKHSRKIYKEGGVYHIYNRGVDKDLIYKSDLDYRVFLHLLKYFLSPQDDKHPLADFEGVSLKRPRPLNTLQKEIDLYCFCLMPNHFHLLLRQITQDGMKKFMHKVCTTYAMYFNKMYQRVGYVFQGRYKAASIEDDESFLHVSRYIHLNPQELKHKMTGPGPVMEIKDWLEEYDYSSYSYYVGKKSARWLNTKEVLSYFDSETVSLLFKPFMTYKQFVEGFDGDSGEVIKDMALDYLEY